ncbi:unnamed protein product [Heterobilharzia americana]|nr:unnamed protein product [Heterobilharzia americana]
MLSIDLYDGKCVSTTCLLLQSTMSRTNNLRKRFGDSKVIFKTMRFVYYFLRELLTLRFSNINSLIDFSSFLEATN